MRRQRQIARLDVAFDDHGRHLAGRVQLGALRHFIEDADRGERPHVRLHIRWHAPDERETRGHAGVYVDFAAEDAK